MSRTRKAMINDYAEQLEWLALAGENLEQAAATLEAVEALIEKDPFGDAAGRIARMAQESLKQRAIYFLEMADDLEATIEQMKCEQEAASND